MSATTPDAEGAPPPLLASAQSATRPRANSMRIGGRNCEGARPSLPPPPHQRRSRPDKTYRRTRDSLSRVQEPRKSSGLPGEGLEWTCRRPRSAEETLILETPQGSAQPAPVRLDRPDLGNFLA